MGRVIRSSGGFSKRRLEIEHGVEVLIALSLIDIKGIAFV